jgi:uncharacterized protein with HEPN domain
MRDRLVHAYFIVDYDIVWNVVAEEIPQVVKGVTEILDTGIS